VKRNRGCPFFVMATLIFSLGQQNLWVDSGSGSFPNV
jgi:hypothetical protein